MELKAYVIDDGWAGGIVILATSPEIALQNIGDRRRLKLRPDYTPYTDEEMILFLKECEQEITDGWNHDFWGDQ